MSRKANMRQNSIITLSDQCKKEIEDVHQEKERLVVEYEKKKKDLHETFLSKQNQLNQIRSEIEEMQPYKELKQRQNEEIDLLEKEIEEVRSEQTSIISELRAVFLREKMDFKRESDNRIMSIVKAANREARECLSENTYKIKVENQKLRSEIFELIKLTKELNKNKEKLEKQKEDLINEIRYTEDLKKLRSTQQQRVLEKLQIKYSEK
jgi:hypothetical protein